MKVKKILETSFTLQPKDSNQKLEIYKCKYCGQTYAKHITRMSVHLLKCSGCPGAVKELLKEKVKDKILESSKHGFNKTGQVRNLKKILNENFVQQPKDANQKLDIFKCKHCEQKYARNASRMSLHLQKCSDCPDEVKASLEVNVKEGMMNKVSRNLIPKKLLENSFVLQPKEPNQKLQTFKCKYCGQVYARHSTRMSLHLQKCIGCPGSIKNSLIEKNKILKQQRKNELFLKKQHDSDNDEMVSDDDNNVQMMQVSTESANFNNSISESNFIGKMSKQRQKYCEELLAKAIYATNAPVSIIDNEHWRTLLNTLSPAFQLPTQVQLSTTLLEATYDSVKKSVDQKVRDAISIGLQCSYRSNARNEGIIEFVLTTPDPVLYKTVPLDIDEESENIYMEKICEMVDMIGPNRILGVCLDGMSNFENLWEVLQQKYEEHKISFYNCSLKTLSQLLKDISELPSINKLLRDISNVLKEIRQTEIVTALINDTQKTATEKNQLNYLFKMPGTKKWGSSLLCLDVLIENRENLKYIIFLPKMDKYNCKVTKELVVDEEFWAKLNCYTKLVRPIIKWINHLDDEEAKISEVPEMFADLEQHFITEFQEPLLLITVDESNQILKRFKTLSTASLQDIHYAANLLNPMFKGERLSPSETSQGQDLITRLSSKFGLPEKDIMIDLAQYNAGSGVWSVNFVKKSADLMPPSTWWRGFFKNSFLTKIAAAILDLPSTSVATNDKSFKKNSLKDDPTGKIMYISQNLRLLDPKRNDKNNKANQEEGEEKVEEFVIENVRSICDGIEEVLVEDAEEDPMDTEDITEDTEEITGEINQVQNPQNVYIQIVDQSGKTYLVQQMPSNVTM